MASVLRKRLGLWKEIPKLLFRTPRLTVRKAVGLSFLSYTFYDHLRTGTITKEQQHVDSLYSTVHHTSKMDRIYDGLPKLPDQRSIRLIKLHGASSRDDDIHIDLATVSLDNPPSYEALSYTWGGQISDQIVYISGMKFCITENVQAVMKELRLKPGKSRYLWIDAICINQEDVTEKNSQVAMMAEIYKKATRVNIWLGDSTKSSRFLFGSSRLLTLPLAPILWIERKILYLDSPTDSLSKKASFFCDMAHNCSLILLGVLLIFYRDALHEVPEIIADGVSDLESRPYWERVWTIQESNMNPNSFLLCGSSMPLHCQILFRALPILNLLKRDHNQETFSSEACELHMRRHDVRLHTGSKKDEGNYLLRRLCTKKATDKVDKIYAVRAFFPETLGTLMPNYSQTAVKTYTDAARSLLEAHRNVRFMRFASHNSKDDGMPTWVPAWTPTHKHKWIWGITATRRPLYQPALIAEDSNDNVLRIKALKVDSLTSTISDFIPKLFPIGRERNDYNVNDLSTAHEACAIFKSWIKRLGEMNNGTIYIDRLDWMLNRMTMLYLGWDRLLRSMKAFDCNSDGQYSIRAEPGEARFVEFHLKELVSVIEDHCFFLTAAERVGISPVPVREGDEIVLLTGETLPYIIRKSSDQPGRFTVVSPCMFTDKITRERTGELGLKDIMHHPWQEWFWGRPGPTMVKNANCNSWGYIDLV